MMNIFHCNTKIMTKTEKMTPTYQGSGAITKVPILMNLKKSKRKCLQFSFEQNDTAKEYYKKSLIGKMLPYGYTKNERVKCRPT